MARASDTCRLPQIRDPNGDFTLQASSGSFVVTPGDGTDPFTCTTSGSSFNCPARAYQKADLTSSGVNAVVTANATASGEVASATQLNGHQDVQVTCAGADCATVASAAGTSFPCAIAITFAAAKKP